MNKKKKNTYKLNLDGNKVYSMEVLPMEDQVKVARQLQRVYVNLSKNVLQKMKRKAGLVGNDVSYNAILRAYIVTTLNQEI